VKAVYCIAELAKSAGISWFAMRRVLLANNVKFLRAGRTILVPLPEIQNHVPQLWEALVALERLRLHGERENPAAATSPRPGGS
jgi:hypothetical protein